MSSRVNCTTITLVMLLDAAFSLALLLLSTASVRAWNVNFSPKLCTRARWGRLTPPSMTADSPSNFFLRRKLKKNQEHLEREQARQTKKESEGEPDWSTYAPNKDFKSGFVSLVGNPNVGKSTLLNALLGEKLSITSPKPQTTRHRIFGICNAEGAYQMVVSDTPGMLEPQYELQSAMRDTVRRTIFDAECVLLVTDVSGEDLADAEIMRRLQQSTIPVVLAINKVDLLSNPNTASNRNNSAAHKPTMSLEALTETWKQRLPRADVIGVSALKDQGVDEVKSRLLSHLPVGPLYYEPDEISSHTERFHASELIRETIFEIYREEIPYCCEVRIMSFKDVDDAHSVVTATVVVERKSQMQVVQGRFCFSLKKLTARARAKLEEFLHRKVQLTLNVAVDEDWRKKKKTLSKFGYFGQ